MYEFLTTRGAEITSALACCCEELSSEIVSGIRDKHQKIRDAEWAKACGVEEEEEHAEPHSKHCLPPLDRISSPKRPAQLDFESLDSEMLLGSPTKKQRHTFKA